MKSFDTEKEIEVPLTNPTALCDQDLHKNSFPAWSQLLKEQQIVTEHEKVVSLAKQLHRSTLHRRRSR